MGYFTNGKINNKIEINACDVVDMNLYSTSPFHYFPFVACIIFSFFCYQLQLDLFLLLSLSVIFSYPVCEQYSSRVFVLVIVCYSYLLLKFTGNVCRANISVCLLYFSIVFFFSLLFILCTVYH